MTINGQNDPKMAKNDPKWPKMTKNCPKMAQNGLKYLDNGPNETRNTNTKLAGGKLPKMTKKWP